MARLTIDYWRVEDSEQCTALAAVLDSVRSWNEDDTKRNFDQRGRVVRLRNVEKAGNLYAGEFTSIAVQDGGYRGNRDGEWEMLEFEDDEGLGYSAAFVLWSSLKVLALQRNRRAASSSVVGAFFRSKFPQLEGLDLIAIPTTDALLRFARLRKATSVEVSLSGGTGAIPDDADASVKDLLALQKRIGVPVLRAQFTVSHWWQTKSAKMEAVKHLLKSLLNGDGGSINKLKVTGLTPDDERDIIDFATERIVDVVELEPDEDRNLSYRLRVGQIKECLRNRKSMLRIE